VFFRCAAWLYDKHPRTLLTNLHLLVDPTCDRPRSKKRDAAKAERKLEANAGVEVLDDEGEVNDEAEDAPAYPPRPHGSFDDLNDLLMLAVAGQLSINYTAHFTAMDGALAPSHAGAAFAQARKMAQAKAKGGKEMTAAEIHKMRHKAFAQVGTFSNKVDVDDRTQRNALYRLSRMGSVQDRTAVLNARAAEAFTDPKLCALYLAVVDLYASYVSADLARLAAHNEYLQLPEERRREEGYGRPGTSPHLWGMSYAAKWAPTPGKSADKQLYVASALALRLCTSTGAAVDTKTARRRFQAEVLTPLRRVLAVPETKMVRGAWTIEYAKVPALAVRRYRTAFYQHDTEGFTKYLNDVRGGKKSIAGATVTPHDMLADAMFNDEVVAADMANLQWAALVDSIRSSSNKELDSCIAVADVSGSMGGLYGMPRKGARVEPIWPCVALTLLLSELARAPWNGSFITFSEDPRLEHIDPSLPLADRAQKLQRANWGMSTDYNKVFMHILNAAQKSKLAPDHMVKKIFVFSDMQFNSSNGTLFGRTEHEEVVRKFSTAGYEVPEIVYWNLAAAEAKPVRADTPGTALVSGFSGALLKYFIRELGEPTPLEEEEDDDDNDDEWDDIAGEKKEKKGQKKEGKTPFQRMMEMVGARYFDGAVVVD
jgi:hypothetical protein